MSGKYSMSDPIWEEISDSAKSLINAMLNLDHKKESLSERSPSASMVWKCLKISNQ